MPVPQNCAGAGLGHAPKNYTLFMIPKPLAERLSISMEFSKSSWRSSPQSGDLAAYAAHDAAHDHDKESKLKLSLETRNQGDVVVVHCQGRVVYREEAAALSGVVREILENGSKVVLDLSGVGSIDSAGIG